MLTKKFATWVLPIILSFSSILTWANPAPASRPDFDRSATHIEKVLGDLVAANTSNPPGQEKKAVEVAKEVLEEAKIEYEVTEFEPGRQNIVARLKGNGKEKPLLLLAHIDVVTAAGQTWSSNPHQIKDDGKYLQGRGVGDDLSFAATALEILLDLKKSGAVLKRDVIMAWTGDEEMGGKGIRYLLKNKKSSIAAEFALNEGGGLRSNESGKVEFASVQVAEKSYVDFQLTAKGPTGHSSVPVKDNSIYRLSRALARLGAHEFPIKILPVIQRYFSERAKLEHGQMAHAMAIAAKSTIQLKGSIPALALKVLQSDPAVNALLHTTCVATLANAGTAPNALPAEATANINCRVLPGESIESVQAEIEKVIQDPQIKVVSERNIQIADASPLEGPVLASITKTVAKKWPGAPIIPSMSTGATDSRHLRAAGIPSYGISPIAMSESEMRRYHGIDEKIRKSSVREGVEYFYELVSDLAVE